MATQGFSVGESSCPFDNVEEFGRENEVQASVDRFSQVFDLVQKGNRAFRQSQFEEAINFFSKALKIKPGDPVILGNRSVAFCRHSQFLRARPPSDSEFSPLNGLDPSTLAELALKDAEKAMNIQSTTTRSYSQKAKALILLERYEEARDTLLLGLQIDPLSYSLQVSLQSLERISGISSGQMRLRKPQRTDDFDCILCLKLLYEPVTTPCGHSFCSSCLFQSMDHGNKCPMCRTVLLISPKSYSVSVTLKSIIQKIFPEEYAERKAEHETLTKLAVDLIPLFVMDVVLPCQKLALNIFEPRYRLMVRRIMQGNHRMGMVILDSTTGSIADFGCEVEITECEPLPDGRFYLEVEGRRRFRIIRSWDQDGYRIAEVQWVQDIYPPEGTKERADLQEMTNNAADYACVWIRRAKEAARRDRKRHWELLQSEKMPIRQDPELFSFWLANLSEQRPHDRLDLLRIRDTKERINRGLIYMRSEEQGCRTQ